MTTVYTGGSFDLFHAGHVHLLRRCRDLAGDGRVIVALNTDDFIMSYKGRPPVLPYADREWPLWACRYVDAVIPNIGGADSRIAIEAAKPDVIAIGSDWFGRDYHAQMGFTQAWLDARGIRLVYLPYTDTISTTLIRQKLAA